MNGKRIVLVAGVGALALILAVFALKPDDDGALSAPMQPTEAEPAAENSELPTPSVNSEPTPLAPGVTEVQPLRLSAPRTEADDSPWSGPRAEQADAVINAPRHLRVVDPLGSPIAGALVEVWDRDYSADEPPVSRDSSDPEGLAWITIPRRSSAVLVSKEGVGTSGIWTAQSAPRESTGETIIELRPTGRLRGQVLSSGGTPETGAQVSFTECSGGNRGTRPRQPLDVLTDADGRFEVEVDARLFTKVAVVVGTRPLRPKLAVVEPGRSSEVTIKVPAYEISGRILGMPSDPDIETKVEAQNKTKPAIDGTLDADGSFVIELTEPAEYGIQAEAEGFVQDQEVLATVDAQSPTARVEVKLVPDATLTGTVRWKNGSPISNAMLHAWPMRDRRTTEEPNFMVFGARAHGGAGGEFELRGLHADLTYCVLVSRDPTVKLGVVRDVTPGTRDLVINAEGPWPRSLTLKGRVHDARTGAPVTRFSTSAVEWFQFGYMGVAGELWHEDPQGRFEIPNLNTNGGYAVLVKADGYAPLNYGPVMLGTSPPTLDLVLSHWGALRVRVVDRSGTAVPEATVRLWPECPRETQESQKPAREATTDTAGTVEWTELSPSPVWLVATTTTLQGGPLRVVLDDTLREATLVMADSQEPGGLDVTLLELDGAPSADWDVRIARIQDVAGQAPTSEKWTCRTDAMGKFKQPVPAGKYSIVSSRFGLFAFSGFVFVASGEWVRVELKFR
jgi:protocatechuate 3,4-dioxygenase beta subunit